MSRRDKEVRDVGGFPLDPALMAHVARQSGQPEGVVERVMAAATPRDYSADLLLQRLWESAVSNRQKRDLLSVLGAACGMHPGGRIILEASLCERVLNFYVKCRKELTG